MGSSLIILGISVVLAIGVPILTLVQFAFCGGMNAADIKKFRFNDRMLMKNSLVN